MKTEKVINISKKTFIGVVGILFALIILAIGMTYFIPSGRLEITEVAGKEQITGFSWIMSSSGINILQGLLAPILVLFTEDGLNIIVLCLFIMIIAGSFQIMLDNNGMKVICNRLIKVFKNNKKALIAIMVFFFMALGAFFGLFEEVLTLLPLILALALSLGYDSYTGFLICVVATGFGFASAITNPFSVITASQIIGVSPTIKLWFRIIIFAAMYCLLLCFIFLHIKRIAKNPLKSPTYLQDREKHLAYDPNEEIPGNKKILLAYSVFLLTAFVSLLIFNSIPALREYTVPILIVVFLIGGLVAGAVCTDDKKQLFKSFFRGFVSGLPAVVLILMASSVKYILQEGLVLDTISYSIKGAVENKPSFLIIMIILLIVLVLEFFISSSTAKAVFVMGILAGIAGSLEALTPSVTKEMLVLIYTFGDGYTNLFFATSPVLLIGLSMCGMNYLQWLKKSAILFLITFVLVIGFLALGLLIGY